MTDTALLRLLSWLSPVFPTGGFAYSAGLEQAVTNGMVRDTDSLFDWIETALTHGATWNDAVLFAASWRAQDDTAAIDGLAELASALSGSAERHKETHDQGKAFLAAARHWLDDLETGQPMALPVAVGLACGRTKIDLETALGAYLHAYVSNQLQAAIRLSVTGQDGAAKLLARLEPVLAATASRAAQSTLDDLGSAAINGEIASMNHETLQPRLFLS